MSLWGDKLTSTNRGAFAFHMPDSLRWGRDITSSVGDDIAAFGQRLFVVHGRSPARIQFFLDMLARKGLQVSTASCDKEPELNAVLALTGECRALKADAVLAIGGGAVMDMGKAVAALATATQDPMVHLEVIGQGRPLDAAPLPFIAVPTTSGTGAEVTKNAVISVPEHQRKVSLRDHRMLPDLAIVDPALTDNSPWPVTLASGLDAITQVIEPWISCKSTILTDALCQEAIPRGIQALIALLDGENRDARDDLSLTSLFGGMALANAGLGVVHGLAGVIGGVSGAAHGAICGRLLVPSLQLNETLMPPDDRQRHQRLQQIRQWLATALDVSPNEALDHFRAWIDSAGLPGLADMGVDKGALGDIAAKSLGSSSMAGNPVLPTETQLVSMMQSALHAR